MHLALFVLVNKVVQSSQGLYQAILVHLESITTVVTNLDQAVHSRFVEFESPKDSPSALVRVEGWTRRGELFLFSENEQGIEDVDEDATQGVSPAKLARAGRWYSCVRGTSWSQP